MITIYCKEEQPDGMADDDFISINGWTGAKPGLLAEIAYRWCGRSQAIVIDDVCADNTIYQGAPFIGPRILMEVSA